MAAPIHQSDVSGTGDGNTFTPTKPAGTVSGDLLLLHVSYEKGSDVTVTSSQWTTREDENQAANVGQRVATRAENGAALTAVTFSQATKFAWTIARITGHDATTPVDAAVGANGSSGNPDPPSATATVAECLAYALCSAKTVTAYTAPSGYTEQWDNQSSGTSQSGASKTLVGAGAENPGTFTPGGSASEWVAATILIKPGTGGLTISPAALGAASAVSPTVARGPVSMTPAALGAAGVVAPTQLRLELEPALLGAASALGPMVVPGLVNVQPGLLGGTAVPAPAMALELEPGALGGALVPALAQLIQEIADPAVLGPASALAPELSQPAGPQTLEPVALGGAAAVGPTLLPGGVVIVVSDLGDAAPVAPALSVGGVAILIGSLGASGVIAPEVLRGGVQVLLSALGGAAAPAPLLTAGGLAIAPGSLGAAAAVAPVVQAGGVSVTLVALGGAASPSPALAQQLAVAVLGASGLPPPVLHHLMGLGLLGGATSIAPVLTPGGVIIEVELVGGGMVLTPQLGMSIAPAGQGQVALTSLALAMRAELASLGPALLGAVVIVLAGRDRGPTSARDTGLGSIRDSGPTSPRS